MGDFIGYRCSYCGKEYDQSNSHQYNCSNLGANLDVILDYGAIQKNFSPRDFFESPIPSMWRYLPLLPVADPQCYDTPLWAVGHTPTFALTGQLGLSHLWLKDESRNPTASFKDRASAIVVARAREVGAAMIVAASSGNAGAALAGMAAAVGQATIILVPKSAPPAKIAQLLVFGARVILVDGSYDDAFDMSLFGTRNYGWYSRNTGFNPFTAEGKKTAAFEIWEWWAKEQSRSPALKDKKLSIFVSVGDGNIIAGIHKGFKDLVALGWLEESPRLFGVQAAGAATVANAYLAGDEQLIRMNAETIADSISVGLPRDGLRGLRAATQTGGAYVVVSDAEILSAIPALGKIGIFAEPAGAAAYAGLVRAVQDGLISPDDPVVVINTGNGLKDVNAAAKSVQTAPVIEPTFRALKRIMEQ